MGPCGSGSSVRRPVGISLQNVHKRNPVDEKTDLLAGGSALNGRIPLWNACCGVWNMRYVSPTRSRLTFLSLILPLRHVYSLSACGPGALFRASGGGGHASPFRPLESPFFVPLRRGVPREPGETGGGGLKSVFGAVPGSPSAEEASAGGAPGRGRTNRVARSPRGLHARRPSRIGIASPRCAGGRAFVSTQNQGAIPLLILRPPSSCASTSNSSCDLSAVDQDDVGPKAFGPKAFGSLNTDFAAVGGPRSAVVCGTPCALRNSG